MATATTHPPAPAPSYQFQQASSQNTPQPHSTQQRPARKSRTFSFRSDKSHSSGSHKVDLRETHAEKEAKRLHSKADPRLAMQEAEPSQVAAKVKSSLASLRNIQHKDAYGNPIVEPDRSNPTRSRWERPLDTIRSFEAAIDGGYGNRRSIIRPGTAHVPCDDTHGRSPDGTGGRFAHDSYYGSRPPSMMYSSRFGGSQQDLRAFGMGQRDSYYEQQPGYGSYGPPAQGGRRGWPRMSSEPQYGSAYRQQNPNEYAIPSNHRSYETVTSASGSGSSGEPAGYQTDPTSSDNSSVERVQSATKRQQEPANDYGIGFSQSATYQPPAFTVGMRGPGMNGGGVGNSQASGALHYGGSVSAPPVPQKDQGSMLRKPISAAGVQERPQQRPAEPEKRKSWFARRFSRHG
ncbi:Meiotically up-regulated gene 9 protein [Madurella mycetomatis]|uniref:Meiotically up-regulated gene 9 protein n=1 Tax=Madurella mycetomatis TaxID=100816 RepID=A0A175WH24_9PEZI|nr:Meiotically up-regulated gene 9 protein [Madurella mycetomatis]